jgi:hypothetical protein
MIYYLASERSAQAMRHFLETWGKALAERLTVVPYERIFCAEPVRLPEGTYIFSSLESYLGSRDPASALREDAGRLRRELAQAFGGGRVLNDPLSFMGRFDLLQALHERGLNRFAAHRAAELGVPGRFPLFLRPALGSLWDAPRLLNTAEEYRAAAGAALDPADTLAVEFCDTADAAGIYRKYACFIVGQRIVPRHVFFSRSWWVKEADLCEPQMVEEELEFLDANPHARALEEIARIANIAYGRIDYGMLRGRPQVWEINHTPLIATGIASKLSARDPVHRRFVTLFAQALDEIDPPAA